MNCAPLVRANHLSHDINSDIRMIVAADALGIAKKDLISMYDTIYEHAKEATESKFEILQTDWRDFRGTLQYERSYLNYFDDDLVRLSYDWQKLLDKYILHDGMLESMIAAVDPLKHLACTYQLQSRELSSETLTLASIMFKETPKVESSEVDLAKLIEQTARKTIGNQSLFEAFASLLSTPYSPELYVQQFASLKLIQDLPPKSKDGKDSSPGLPGKNKYTSMAESQIQKHDYSNLYTIWAAWIYEEKLGFQNGMWWTALSSFVK